MAIIIYANEIDFTQSKKLRDSFSYEALQLIHKYYEDWSEQNGEDIIFNPNEIIASWAEMEKDEIYYTDPELFHHYGLSRDCPDSILDWLEEETTVYHLKRGTILYRKDLQDG